MGAALSLSDWDWTEGRWRMAGATLWTGQSGKPSIKPHRMNYPNIKHLYNSCIMDMDVRECHDFFE